MGTGPSQPLRQVQNLALFPDKSPFQATQRAKRGQRGARMQTDPILPSMTIPTQTSETLKMGLAPQKSGQESITQELSDTVSGKVDSLAQSEFFIKTTTMDGATPSVGNNCNVVSSPPMYVAAPNKSGRESKSQDLSDTLSGKGQSLAQSKFFVKTTTTDGATPYVGNNRNLISSGPLMDVAAPHKSGRESITQDLLDAASGKGGSLAQSEFFDKTRTTDGVTRSVGINRNLVSSAPSTKEDPPKRRKMVTTLVNLPSNLF